MEVHNNSKRKNHSIKAKSNCTSYYILCSGKFACNYCSLIDVPSMVLRVTQTRVVFLCRTYKQLTFNGNSYHRLFAIFLSNQCGLLSDDLATYSLQRSKRITDEKQSYTLKKTLKFTIV